MMFSTLCAVLVVTSLAFAADDVATKPELPSYPEFKPQQELEATPPADAIVLLSPDVNRFVSKAGGQIDWPSEEGVLTSSQGKARTNHIVSTVHFRDAEIHAEFQLPEKGVGNSGLYIHGHYEMQIYNSIGHEKPNDHDMGALYGFAKPLVNAAKKPGEWQVYDIRYIAPRRDVEGKIVVEGSITAWLNGEKVQHETRFGEPRSVYHPYRHETTPYLQAIGTKQKEKSIGPLFLQDHDNPVKFRNIWIRPLDGLQEDYVPQEGKGGEEAKGKEKKSP